ncbi:MAG: Gfo/Idh/MocA family oxidoreductase [Saprospiraceae bacterium]|nr:Gfo/Idh/MocA family oxidoreductase [Saprospiraceae bacterium]
MVVKIKIACIGAGYFARFHLEAWKRIPEVELVAICDQDELKAKKMAIDFGVRKTYVDLDAMLQAEEFTVLDVITPPQTHLSLCEKAIHFGKHIICQKPLAPELNEAEELVSLGDRHNVRFMVHENFRFQPWYRKIKSMMDQGMIGNTLHTITIKLRTGDGWGHDAYLDRQPYFQTMPRLLIYETGIHYIDVFRYLAGDISTAFAQLRRLNPVIAGEDCGVVLLDFINGGIGIIDANRYNESNSKDPRYTFGETTVEGNMGTIRLYTDGKITLQPLGHPEVEQMYHHDRRNFASDCVFNTQCHFVNCYLQGLPFETSGHDYLKNIYVQEAIYQSNTRKEIIIL